MQDHELFLTGFPTLRLAPLDRLPARPAIRRRLMRHENETQWAVLITVYRPDPERWMNWRARRKR